MNKDKTADGTALVLTVVRGGTYTSMEVHPESRNLINGKRPRHIRIELKWDLLEEWRIRMMAEMLTGTKGSYILKSPCGALIKTMEAAE